jgi:ribosomal protein S18 acetylase RimI-like enzyme
MKHYDSAILTMVSFRKLSPEEPAPYDLLLQADPSKKLIDQYLATGYLYIAVLQEAVIGTYVLYPLDAATAEIKNISVQNSYQGKGIGQLMLTHAIQVAQQAGFKIICIGTANSSIGQLYLYQKMGFELSSIRKDFFTTNYDTPLFENGIQCKHLIMLSRAT